ncbi:MAG: hypothetical protein HY904_03650 [Deltaproteobacteria bacterium]|nr:hypothetical protein [Deltaproteobacteria bacterium]
MAATTRAVPALLLVAAAGTHAWLDGQVQGARPPVMHPNVPSYPVALFHGLLRGRAAADIQWLRFASYAGDNRHQAVRPALQPLLRLVLDLDSGFADAWWVGALILSTEKGGEREAAAVAHEAGSHFPNQWRFPFLEGALQLTALFNTTAAAAAWERASALPDAPPYLAQAAGRLRSRDEACLIAQRTAEQILDMSPPGQGQAALAARVRDLKVECTLRNVEAAVASYRQREGRLPATLDEVVAAGLLGGVPRAAGQPVVLAGDGSVNLAAPVPRIHLRGHDAPPPPGSAP